MKFIISILFLSVYFGCASSHLRGVIDQDDVDTERRVGASIIDRLTRKVIFERNSLGGAEAVLEVMPKTDSYLRYWAENRVERKESRLIITSFDAELKILKEANTKRKSCFIFKLSAKSKESQKYVNYNNWRFILTENSGRRFLLRPKVEKSSEAERLGDYYQYESYALACSKKIDFSKSFTMQAIEGLSKAKHLLRWN